MFFYNISSDETCNKRNVPQHNKGCRSQTGSKHHTIWAKAEIISYKVRTRKGYPTLNST
jgi:hypothetical protein